MLTMCNDGLYDTGMTDWLTRICYVNHCICAIRVQHKHARTHHTHTWMCLYRLAVDTSSVLCRFCIYLKAFTLHFKCLPISMYRYSCTVLPIGAYDRQQLQHRTCATLLLYCYKAAHINSHTPHIYFK